MKHQKYISIPNPCHENWDLMLPEEKGRHCLKCEKTVTDFSSMPDYQIINYIKKHKIACGRFTPEQLQRPYNFLRTKTSPPLFKALVFTLMNFIAGQSNAQFHKTDSGDSIPDIVSISPVDSPAKLSNVEVAAVKDSFLTTDSFPSITLGPMETISGLMVMGCFYQTPEICVYDTKIETITYKILALPSDSVPPLAQVKTNKIMRKPMDAIKKLENKKKQPMNLFFQWMASIPVYRLLKKSLKIK